jgi:hypothetical protein
MPAFDFKSRFLAALPPIPPELDLNWDEFVVFDADTVASLAEEDAEFLTTQGLPCDAAPFLSFYAYSEDEVAQRLEVFSLAENILPLGHNGSGDILALDKNTREVVNFNHDADNLRIFINSTLPKFAESLCVYQEHQNSKSMHQCLADIAAVDSMAAQNGCMWHSEIMAEITGD